MSTYKGFPLQQHVGILLLLRSFSIDEQDTWWCGYPYPPVCGIRFYGRRNANLEMIRVVYRQVMQLLTGVCRRARTQQTKQKERWKHRAVSSHFVLRFKRSAGSLSDSVPIVNSLFMVEISTANTLFRLPGTTVASETEPVTAGNYNTVLKAPKNKPHGQHTYFFHRPRLGKWWLITAPLFNWTCVHMDSVSSSLYDAPRALLGFRWVY